MRIVLAHNFYQQAGGEDKVFYAEKSLLEEKEHIVSTLTKHNDEILRYSLPQKFLFPFKTVYHSTYKRYLRRFIEQARPDIVHFHNTFPLISPAAYDACYEANVPVVQTLHNFRLLCPSALFLRSGKVCEDCLGKTPPWPALRHACYRNSRTQTAVLTAMLTSHRILRTWQNKVNTYIVLNSFARQKFIDGGLPPDKIVVKPNFVAEPGIIPKSAEYALFVGRLSEEKGIKVLINAWENVKDIPLKIIGNGPLFDLAKRLIETYKIRNAELLGKLSSAHVWEYLSRATFLVMPSICYENLPMTIIEAFAAGVPVIASRLGGMAEIVTDRHTGLHFTPGDAVDLAKKIRWAWENSPQMSEMSKAARKEYENKYTAEKNYQMLLKIYQNAIKNQKKTAR